MDKRSSSKRSAYIDRVNVGNTFSRHAFIGFQEMEWRVLDIGKTTCQVSECSVVITILKLQRKGRGLISRDNNIALQS